MKTTVTQKREVKKLFRRLEMNCLSAGYKQGFDKIWGRMAKIGLLGRKPSFWAQKSVEFLMDTMIWPRTGKVVQKKNFLFPK